MAAVDPYGNQKYWIDGMTFEGVKKQASGIDTGSQLYWVNGMTEQNLFPNTINWPSFFLMFE